MNAGKNKTHAYDKSKFIPHIINDTFAMDTYSVDDLGVALDFVKKEGINLLIINGGDGTLQMTITELIKQMPAEKIPIILPLRGGTMNMVTNNLGIRKSPIDTVRIMMRHVDAFNRGEEELSTIPLKVLKIRDDRLGVRYGFTFSNGIVYKIHKAYYATGSPSFQTAVNLTTTIIGSFALGTSTSKKYFEKIKAHIEIDGRPYPYDRVLLSVASVLKKLVLWFKPFHEPDRKGLDDFYFFAISINSFDIVANIRALSTGRLVHEKSFNGIARTVRIQSETGYGIDGELTDDEPSDVTITEGPPINFLVVPESIRTNMMGFTFKHWLNSDLIINHNNAQNDTAHLPPV